MRGSSQELADGRRATRGRVMRDELSYCRICAAACGVVVSVDGDRVVRVRGDDEHPVSRGYTCSKGRGLAAWHHSPDRFQRDRRKQNDLVARGWTVLRFTWSDLTTRPEYVVRQVREALRLGNRNPRP